MTARNPLAHKDGRTVELPAGDTIKPENMPEVTTTTQGVVPATGTPTGKFLKDDKTWDAPSGGGDVVGPASSTNNALALWTGTGGDTLKDGFGVAVDFISKNVTQQAANTAFSVGTLTLDMATGNVFKYTLNATDGAVTTFAISNSPAAGSFGNLGEILFTVTQDATTSYIFTWTNVTWSQGTVPNLSNVSSKAIVHLWTLDAGTTWYGRILYLFTNCTIPGNDSNTVLLIHSDTTNSDTLIDDISASDHQPTVEDNAQHSTDQHKFGGSSLKFDGELDRIVIPYSVNFDFSASDFTIDFWIYYTGAFSSGRGIITTSTVADTGWRIYITSATGHFCFEADNSSNISTINIQSSSELIINTWHHIAAVGNGSSGQVTKLYLDGVEVASGSTIAGAFKAANGDPLALGAKQCTTGNHDTLNFIEGYLDEIRISRVKRWTGSFTPPSTPYCNEG